MSDGTVHTVTRKRDEYTSSSHAAGQRRQSRWDTTCPECGQEADDFYTCCVCRRKVGDCCAIKLADGTFICCDCELGCSPDE